MLSFACVFPIFGCWVKAFLTVFVFCIWLSVVTRNRKKILLTKMIWFFTYKYERGQEIFRLQLFWLLWNLPSFLLGRNWIRLFCTPPRADLYQWGLIHRTPPPGTAFLSMQFYWVQEIFAWCITIWVSAAPSYVAPPVSPSLHWCSWQQDLTSMIPLLLWHMRCN